MGNAWATPGVASQYPPRGGVASLLPLPRRTPGAARVRLWPAARDTGTFRRRGAQEGLATRP
eukprot:3811488-Alexandrium_andersonii.AAC.1